MPFNLEADDTNEVILEEPSDLPTCRLSGTDGNVFAIIGTVSRALKKAGQHAEAEEFKQRATSGEYDYHGVIGLAFEYVDVE